MNLLVEENPARRRFEILVDGSLAGFVTYQPRPDEVILIHTEVEPRFGDMGVGSALARGTLEQLRQRGDRVLVRCPFITAYLRRHPEYADLAVPE